MSRCLIADILNIIFGLVEIAAFAMCMSNVDGTICLIVALIGLVFLILGCIIPIWQFKEYKSRWEHVWPK